MTSTTTTYDFILVLGCPTQKDGSLSSFQKRRIHAAIDYYEQGYASTILVSGGSVQNKYIEAEVMAEELKKACPTATILLETQARNTYQNILYAKEMMVGNQILVISGSSHLRRAYFFVRKFYPHADMGFGKERDPWYSYLWEITRMWNTLYWEMRLHIRKKRH